MAKTYFDRLREESVKAGGPSNFRSYTEWINRNGNRTILTGSKATGTIRAVGNDIIQDGNSLRIRNAGDADLVIYTYWSQTDKISDIVNVSVHNLCRSVHVTNSVQDDLKAAENSAEENSKDRRLRIGFAGEKYVIDMLKNTLPSGSKIWGGGKNGEENGDIDLFVMLPDGSGAIIDVKARTRTTHGEEFSLVPADSGYGDSTGYTIEGSSRAKPMSVAQRKLLDEADKMTGADIPVIIVPVLYDYSRDGEPFNNPGNGVIVGRKEKWHGQTFRQFVASSVDDLPQTIERVGQPDCVEPSLWTDFTFEVHEKVK